MSYNIVPLAETTADTLRLPKGPLKVILTNTEAIRENARRARNLGTRFAPTFLVFVEGEDGKASAYGAFRVRHTATTAAKKGETADERSIDLRCNADGLPFPWATSATRGFTSWAETTDELILTTKPD